MKRFLLTSIAFLLTWSSVSLSQTFENTAADNGEAPYITKMILCRKSDNIVLQFVGDLKLGRQARTLKRNTKQTFDTAVHQLLVSFDNEALEDFAVTVGPDEAGNLKAFPGSTGISVKSEPHAVTLTVPSKLLQYSPVEISAEVQSLYFAGNGMLAGQGRNLFSGPEGKPVCVSPDGLSAKAEMPVIEKLSVKDIESGSAVLSWQTNNRTTAIITLRSDAGQPRVLTQEYRSRSHLTTLADLQPDTQYMVSVCGSDFSARVTPIANVSFRTSSKNASKGKEDAWLRVKGKYIVDSSGKPFALGGYSHYLGEYWYNEFPRYGTPALTARYFRSMGFNACRLGVLEYKPGWWAASIMRDSSAFDRYGGAAGFVKKFLRPIVDQIVSEGVYVIIDWHWTYKMTDQDISKIGDFWEAVAIEFKDEPRVAMFQLLNEPCFADGSNRPDLAERIRKITRDYIRRIRKHDKRHIILVSDWNCGWGWATASQWKPVNFNPGDPQRQVVFSKHISREHLNQAFMAGGVDSLADRHNIPLFFDEVESGPLMNSKETGWFYQYLSRNHRKYGFLIWVCGQYPMDFSREASAFAQTYLPRAPFGGDGSNPIVEWWRLGEPSEQKRGKKFVYRYRLARPLPAGDYGIVCENPGKNTVATLMLAPRSEKNKLIGGWLGKPGMAAVRGLTMQAGQSAIDGASYFHALKPFVEVVICSNTPFPEKWRNIQLFRLNPKHQMPVPRIQRMEVSIQP